MLFPTEPKTQKKRREKRLPGELSSNPKLTMPVWNIRTPDQTHMKQNETLSKK
jgi:hypothetical protein